MTTPVSEAVERLRPACKYVGPTIVSSEDIRATLAEITRLEQALIYQEARADRIGTHGPGCWSWGPSHYECAEREIARLTDQVRVARECIDETRFRWLAIAKADDTPDGDRGFAERSLSLIDHHLTRMEKNDD